MAGGWNQVEPVPEERLVESHARVSSRAHLRVELAEEVSLRVESGRHRIRLEVFFEHRLAQRGEEGHVEQVRLCWRGTSVLPRLLPYPLLLSPPASGLFPSSLSLLGATAVIHLTSCEGVGYGGQALTASRSLIILLLGDS